MNVVMIRGTKEKRVVVGARGYLGVKPKADLKKVQIVTWDLEDLWSRDLVVVTEEGLTFNLPNLLTEHQSWVMKGSNVEEVVWTHTMMQNWSEWWFFDPNTDEEVVNHTERLGTFPINVIIDRNTIQEIDGAWKDMMMDEEAMTELDGEFNEDIIDSLKDFKLKIIEHPRACVDEYTDMCEWVSKQLGHMAEELSRRLNGKEADWN